MTRRARLAMLRRLQRETVVRILRVVLLAGLIGLVVWGIVVRLGAPAVTQRRAEEMRLIAVLSELRMHQTAYASDVGEFTADVDALGLRPAAGTTVHIELVSPHTFRGTVEREDGSLVCRQLVDRGIPPHPPVCESR